jgi:hypothetical protein
MSWYKIVLQKLEKAGIFAEVRIIGAKIRANIDETIFLDIHYDPITTSYSYALIDLKLPYLGDKRIFGWDDYPHEGVKEIKDLRSYPHHFQRRLEENWIFEESDMRGDVAIEIETVIMGIKSYLKAQSLE